MPVTFGTIEVMPASEPTPTPAAAGGDGASSAPRPADPGQLAATLRRMAARAARVRAH